MVITSENKKIFLCHSSVDKSEVNKLYKRLKDDGYDLQFSDEDLIPGQGWREEIEKAVKACGIVIVCLSNDSIKSAGFVHREINWALDIAQEKPVGTIFIIPLKLHECEIPTRLEHLQWVNYFEKGGYEKLLRALKQREIIAPLRPFTNKFRNRIIYAAASLVLIFSAFIIFWIATTATKTADQREVEELEKRATELSYGPTGTLALVNQNAGVTPLGLFADEKLLNFKVQTILCNPNDEFWDYGFELNNDDWFLTATVTKDGKYAIQIHGQNDKANDKELVSNKLRNFDSKKGNCNLLKLYVSGNKGYFIVSKENGSNDQLITFDLDRPMISSYPGILVSYVTNDKIKTKLVAYPYRDFTVWKLT